MEHIITQKIYYSNKKRLPAREIAESLMALDAVIEQSGDVIEAIFPDITVERIDIFIESIKSDSLLEDIIVKLIFGDTKKLDDMISATRKKTGIDKFMDNPQALSAILLAMIVAGGSYAIGKYSAATPTQKAIIEANNNTILNIGAGMIDIEAGELKALIEGGIKDKDKLAKNAIKVIKPAKFDPSATITFSDNPNLSINQATIAALPDSMPEPEEEEIMEDVTGLELEIRAIDLDSFKRGWAVAIPGMKAKRVRLQLDPLINPTTLIGKTQIKADATISYKTDKDIQKIPKLVFLRKVY